MFPRKCEGQSADIETRIICHFASLMRVAASPCMPTPNHDGCHWQLGFYLQKSGLLSNLGSLSIPIIA